MRSVVEVNSRRVGENFTEEMTVQFLLYLLLLVVACTHAAVFFELSAPIFPKFTMCISFKHLTLKSSLTLVLPNGLSW